MKSKCNNPIKAIAFDLEGTVVDVENVHHQAHLLSAKDIGLDLSLEEGFVLIPYFIGGPDEKAAEEIANLAGKKGIFADKNYILAQKKKHYNRLLGEIEIKPRPGFVDFFQIVKKMGIKCTIGSLTNRDQALVLLERSGIGKLFGYDNIVLREDIQNQKPAPDVWIATAKKANVEPAQQLVFEDSPRGIRGAVKIGAYCIGMPVYNRPDTIHDLVKEGAQRIFFCWSEINPHNLLKNINEERAKEMRNILNDKIKDYN